MSKNVKWLLQFNKKRYHIGLSALIIMIFIPNVYAVSPYWPMPFHDSQNTGQSEYVGATTNLLNWKFPIGNVGYASPVVGGDGTIYVTSAYSSNGNLTYVGSGTTLYALNPDGTEKWHFGTGAIFYGPALGNDGTIYISSSDGNLYAINPDRTIKWTYSTGAQIETSPVLDSQGDAYVGLIKGELVAVNSIGIQKWSFVTGGGIDAPTIGTDDTIYVGGSDNPHTMPRGGYIGGGNALYAINPDGSEKWEIKNLFGPIFTTVGRDNTVYLANFFGNLEAYNPDGTLKWSVRTGEVVGPPALNNDGTLYFGGEKRIFAVNPDGKIKWTFDTAWESFGFSAPAIDANGIVYVVNNNGIVYAINPDGTIKWSYFIGDKNQNGGTYSPAIGPNQVIYVAYNHFLYAIGNLSSTSVTSGQQSSITQPTIFNPTYLEYVVVILLLILLISVLILLTKIKKRKESILQRTPTTISSNKKPKSLLIVVIIFGAPIYSLTILYAIFAKLLDVSLAVTLVVVELPLILIPLWMEQRKNNDSRK